MVVDSEGYHQLIEYFTEHLSLFETGRGESDEEPLEEIVTDMIASNLMMVFQQNPDIDAETRFTLMKEADRVMEDLSEVLASVWLQPPTAQQIGFLEDYVSLVKNLFDNAIAVSTLTN